MEIKLVILPTGENSFRCVVIMDILLLTPELNIFLQALPVEGRV